MRGLQRSFADVGLAGSPRKTQYRYDQDVSQRYGGSDGVSGWLFKLHFSQSAAGQDTVGNAHTVHAYRAQTRLAI